MNRDWVKTIVSAEEQAHEIDRKKEKKDSVVFPIYTESKENKNKKQEDKQVVEEKSTKIVRKTNEELSNSLKIEKNTSWGRDKDIGPGKLEQLSIKAGSSNFTTILKIDNDIVVFDKWSDLNSTTIEIDSIAAFQDGNNFVVSINNIHFKHNISASIIPHQSILFKTIYMEVTLNG